MTATLPALEKLGPNPDWAALPLFQRKGWTRKAFGAFAESMNVRVEPADAAEEIYVGLDDLDSGCLHIRRWGKGSDVIGTKLRFRKGDIIFGRRRAYQRKLAVAEMEGICSAHAMVVRARPDVVRPEFLPFLMMSDKFMRRAVEISVGSLSPTINWTTLKHEEFDLPPLDQQRRIAEILWAVDETEQAFSRALLDAEEVSRASARETILVDAGNGLSTTFGEVADLIHGFQFRSNHFDRDGTVAVVKIEQVVGDGVVDVSACEFVSDETFRQLEKFQLLPGDIVMSLTGNIGRVGIISKSDKVLVQNYRVGKFIPKNGTDKNFLFHLLNSGVLLDLMLKHSNATAQSNLGKAELERIPVSIPVPSQQHESLISSIGLART